TERLALSWPASWLSAPKTGFVLERASRTAGTPENIRHCAPPVVSAVGVTTQGICSAALCPPGHRAPGPLLYLPLFPHHRARCRGFAPGRLLSAEARQWRFAVHGGD